MLEIVKNINFKHYVSDYLVDREVQRNPADTGTKSLPVHSDMCHHLHIELLHNDY